MTSSVMRYAVALGMCYAVVLWITHGDLPRLQASGIKNQPDRRVSFCNWS